MNDKYANNFYVLRDHYSNVFCAWRTPASAFSCILQRVQGLLDIRSCEVIAGDLPGRQIKLVLAWAELHQEELMADWKLVTNGEEPFKIKPLQ
ncbi:MAG: DUF4160 domain-containing protein [Smithellaceae bacterium]|jgi:hypothetical protein|nr:DUF4160 domain-containing protein [Smithellaceae bacterium]